MNVHPGILILVLVLAFDCSQKPGIRESGTSSPDSLQSSDTSASRAILLAQRESARQPRSGNQPRLTVRLKDGSRISGTTKCDVISVRASYGTFNLPFKDLSFVEFLQGRDSVRVIFRNGDKLHAVLSSPICHLTTLFGVVTMDPKDILSIEIEITVRSSKEDLLAYYPFNGNANDESGRYQDGTAHGAVLTSDRFGKENSAYRFDGNKAYISIPGGLVPPDAPAFTISVWLRAADVEGPRMAIYLGGATGEAKLQTWGRRILFGFRVGSGWYSVSSDVFLETWFHVAGVYRRGSSCQLWINGVTKDQRPLPAEDLSSLNDAPHSCIGSYSPVNARPTGIRNWVGEIDEVRIYNRALAPEEIQSLFSGRN